MKIGIPRSLYYYYFKDLWINFFKLLNIDIVVSPETNKEILELGINNSNDEMCLSMKDFIGHVMYLKDKCDYILIPRIDNFGSQNQTCTNFLAVYDIVNNLIQNKILDYNIDLENGYTEEKGLIDVCLKLNITFTLARKAYIYSKEQENNINKQKYLENINKFKSNKKKILLVSHPYNTYNNLIGKPIIDLLYNLNVEIIYSDLFLDSNKYKSYSNELYWKYSKDLVNSIVECKNKVDGVIFLSSFPCGLDSLVNELLIRKIKIPYINIIIDDINSLSGIETRIESFVDILNIKI